MKQNILLRELEVKGLSINTIADYLLKEANLNENNAIDIERVLSQWNNTSIDEIQAGHIIASATNFNEDRDIKILDNLQNIYACLNAAKYKRVIDMTFEDLLKTYVSETLRRLAQEIRLDNSQTPSQVAKYWAETSDTIGDLFVNSVNLTVKVD